MAAQFEVLGPAAVALFYDLIRDPDLVGLWVMNEKSGTIYDRCSKNRLNGTVAGNPTYSKAIGAGFYGLDFDGTGDYVDLGNVSALNFERTDAFSAVALVDPNVATTLALLSKKDSAGSQAGWMWTLNSTIKQGLTLRSGSGNQIVVTADNALSNGTDYLLGFSYSGSSAASGVIFYKDGAVDASTATSDTLSATIQNAIAAQIGAVNATLPFNGDIGMLAVFNAVKTAADFRRWAYLSRTL